MNSKILPFNKILMKKDWKMTKWLSYFILVILFFSITLEVISSYGSYQNTLNDIKENPEFYENFDIKEDKNARISYIQYRFKSLSQVDLVLIVFAPIVVVALLFGEEKRRKTFEVLATMPFKRWEIFFNKLIVAFVNIIIPFLINALIMTIALKISKGLRDFYSINLVVSWLGSNIFRLFILTSFSFLFATLTGTTVAQVVLTTIFLIFPIGFTALIGFNMEAWGYEFLAIHVFLEKLEKYTILGMIVDLENVSIGFHMISAIIMLILAKFLFDRNKLERSGETLEFESLETFFKVGVTICTSLLGGILFSCFEYTTILSKNVLIVLGYIVGLLIGWLASTYSIKFNRGKA